MDVYWIHFATIDSTNTWAKEHAQEFDPKKLTCIVADMQTAGRGRFSRSWVGAKGNLMMSLFFHLDPKDPILPNLAQILALSCIRILRIDEIQIKWPNDLVVDGKKLAGILVETVPAGGVVVGLGMNVNVPVETDQAATSLYELTGRKWNLKELRGQIVTRFQKDLKGGFVPEEFEEVLAYQNQQISCLVGKEMIEGMLIGINDRGQLKIKLADESIRTIYSGDIQRLRCT